MSMTDILQLQPVAEHLCQVMGAAGGRAIVGYVVRRSCALTSTEHEL